MITNNEQHSSVQIRPQYKSHKPPVSEPHTEPSEVDCLAKEVRNALRLNHLTMSSNPPAKVSLCSNVLSFTQHNGLADCCVDGFLNPVGDFFLEDV